MFIKQFFRMLINNYVKVNIRDMDLIDCVKILQRETFHLFIP
jgi:hypothetical protein